MLVAFPLFFILHLLLEEVEAQRILMLGYVKWWAATWGFLSGFKMEVVKNSNVRKDEAYVFVGNHNSNLDAMLWVYATDNLFKGLAKKELLSVPVLGYLFKKTCIIVDRSDKESRRKSIDKMKEEMKRGISIYIYPEGTRNKTDKPLQPFRDGAFRMAIDLQKPLVPVVMLNTKTLMPGSWKLFTPGTVKCIFMDPIPTEGLSELYLDELKSKVFSLMEGVVVKNDNRLKDSEDITTGSGGKLVKRLDEQTRTRNPEGSG